jgi:hypothetical protein
LKNDPAGAVFDEQESRVGVIKAHFNSHECAIDAVKELVAAIRSKEQRFGDLEELLK